LQQSVVIGTLPGPNGQPIPIVMDPNTGNWTPGYPNTYEDPFTHTSRQALKKGGQCYLNTMDTIADTTKSLPDKLQPKGQPYPGFWGDVGRALLPLRRLLGLP